MFESPILTCQLFSLSIKHLLSAAFINNIYFMRNDGKIQDMWSKWKELNDRCCVNMHSRWRWSKDISVIENQWVFRWRLLNAMHWGRGF